MKTYFKLIAVLTLITVGGAVLWLPFADKQTMVLKDGTTKTVDNVWESGNSIYFVIDTDIFMVDQDKVESYGKRNFSQTLLEFKTLVVNGFKLFASPFNSIQFVFLLGLLFFLVACFCAGRMSNKEKPAPNEKPSPVTVVAEDPSPSEIIEEVPARIQIVCFFLNLFRQQIGAKLDAEVEYVRLASKNSGPSEIYELRVKKSVDWTKRRMTIGPLGEESGSKSKCYYVIYDVHMVIKIPAKPITDFEKYLISIEKEASIANKLIPKECIIPNVSVILSMIHSFPNSDGSTADQLETRYIELLRHSPEYQEYLKINSTFIYIMDLSKYYFLSHILDELHDVKDLITKEISENAAIIWEPTKFIGRYGTDNDALFEIRDIYNRCAVDIRRLADSTGITATISDYQIQSWFIAHLASGEVSIDGSGYPEDFIADLNCLIEETIQDSSKVIEVYRQMIKEYVYMSSFRQNKVQMGAITANLLEILAWFQKKRISMRDLKPDNLFVAGDNQAYPRFLRSASEFSLGIIDVETAVDFEQHKYLKIAQPLLGGTPFYATPSHFFKNDILLRSFGDVGKTLHLQDWHATLVMIYKVITGKALFDNTAKLFTNLRDMMIMANHMNGRQADDTVAEASRVFWNSAVAEFQINTAASAEALKTITITIPESVREMFGRVLEKERRSIAGSIKECVETQSIFEKDEIRAVLLNASYTKTCQFKADLENKAKDSGNPTPSRTEAIMFLHQLADLKARFGQHVYIQKLLSQPEPTLSAYDILTFMFNVVLHNMYKPHWAPLFGKTAVACEQSDGETVFVEPAY